MEIAVIGVGGVGGFFGGKLAHHINTRNSNAEITFVARGDHLERIKAVGLKLRTPNGESIISRPTRVTENIRDVEGADIFLVCPKSYDLDRVLEDLSHISTGKTVIISPLNGLDVYERIKARISKAIVLPSCAYVSTAITGSGEVTQFGGPGRLVLGPDPQRNDYDSRPLMELLLESGIAAEWSDYVVKEIWGKYIFIAPLGLVTASADKTIGEVLESDDLKDKLVLIIQEIEAISREMEIDLDDDILNISIAKCEAFPYDTKTSFQRDIEMRKPQTEIDIFGDTVIELGKIHNVPTPETSAIVSQLKNIRP